MAEMVFSSIKRMYGEYICICNQIPKYDKREVSLYITYLEKE